MVQFLTRFVGFCVVLTAFVGVSIPAYGDAIYSADLTATLTSPPAITNLYGFANFVGIQDTFAFGGGDHGATGNAAVSLVPLGLRSTASAYGFANGVPGAPAFAVSDGRTEQKFRMANLSGVILPRQDLTVDLMLNLSYSLYVHAAIPGWDIARAGIIVRINRMVVYSDELITPPDATVGPLTFTQNIPITLPAESVTNTFFDITVYGNAESSRPPEPPPPDLPPPPNPIPEPTSLVLLSIGALSLLGYGRRHRKPSHESPTS